MRRFLLSAACAVVLLSGCGSSSSGSSSQDAALGYFPKDAPFLMSIQTDPNSSAVQQAEQLVGQFPLAALGESALKAKLSQIGINYSSDVRPLFGNPIVIGLAAAPSGMSAGGQVLIVWTTKDAGKLHSLLTKVLHGVKSTGTRDGATLYQAGTTTFAVNGATLIVSPSSSALDRALDRQAHGGGLSSADEARDLNGLPQDALIESFGDTSGLLASPSAAKARQVPWVAALRGYGTAVTVDASGIRFRYRVDSSGTSLGGSQLPVAAGSTPPGLAGTMPIQLGLKDPAQTVSFLQSAEQATGSESYTRFLTRQAVARRKVGVDLTSLFPLFTGDLNLESDGHATLVRIGLGDPSQASAILAKLAHAPQAFSSTATSVRSVGSGMYQVAGSATPVIVGVCGNQLVIGERTTPALLTQFASAPATAAPGAQGSVAFRIALPSLLRLAFRQQATSSSTLKMAGTILGLLGDLTGWASATTGELSGAASLGIR